MKCNNCGNHLTCGCQQRIAANGKQCCSNCIGSCNQSAGTNTIQYPNQTPYTTTKSPYTPHT